MKAKLHWKCPFPLYVAMFWRLFTKIADDKKMMNAMEDGEEKSSKKTIMCGLTCCLLIALAFVLVFVILSVVRLNGAGYGVAIVFIPVFIVMGCVLLCCCLCGPCLCLQQPEGPNFEEGGSEEDTESAWWEVKKHKYLESPSPPRPTESSPLREEEPEVVETTANLNEID